MAASIGVSHPDNRPPEGHGIRGGLSGKERAALKRATSLANGTKFGRPRKVDDTEHIATAKRMEADYMNETVVPTLKQAGAEARADGLSSTAM